MMGKNKTFWVCLESKSLRHFIWARAVVEKEVNLSFRNVFEPYDLLEDIDEINFYGVWLDKEIQRKWLEFVSLIKKNLDNIKEFIKDIKDEIVEKESLILDVENWKWEKMKY